METAEEMDGQVVDSPELPMAAPQTSGYSLALLEQLAAHSRLRRAAQSTIPLPRTSWETLEAEEPSPAMPQSASADELAEDVLTPDGSAMDEEVAEPEDQERSARGAAVQPAAEAAQPATCDAPSLLLEALTQYRTVLLDVRGAEARDAEPLPIASRWCPVEANDSEQLRVRAETLLPRKDATIVAFGDEWGHRSARAKLALKELGYSRVVNAGGVAHVIACLEGSCGC